MEWSRVDLKEGLFYLEGGHTKSGKRRSVRNGFLDACAEAGITDFRIHDMRHTAARKCATCSDTRR